MHGNNHNLSQVCNKRNIYVDIFSEPPSFSQLFNQM